MRNTRTRALGATVALLGAVALFAPSGASAAGSGFKVTIAARWCPTYTDITANRARNNIQESLRDLGADTPYKSGEAIDPTIEEDAQPNCTPIPNWSFTLGKGYKSRAVNGPWGSLSIVTNPFAAPVINTQASIPLLNTIGQPTGKTLAGATTIELTQEQRDLAARGNSLWLQGGTPTDPILNVPYPDEYGFGALRCAIDDLNGDNVEWISFPSGTTHVFCYAYYVKPPPTSGTIVVRKTVDAPAGTQKENFRFTGNISFNEDDSFTLPSGPGSTGSQTFYRAETGTGAPWTFTEQVPAGWTLADISCTSRDGTSSTVTDQSKGATAVRLGAGDLVTCTYTDRLTPPPAGLLLRKISLGDVGTFGFTISGDSGSTTASATTKIEGVPTVAEPGSLSLDPGEYEISERLPRSNRGKWNLLSGECSGEERDLQPLRLTLESGTGTVCTFTNKFVPNGTIRLYKKTVGAVGEVGFIVSPLYHDPPLNLAQSATTTQEGEAVLAEGDRTSNLPLGRYVIQETTPTETTEGVWSLDSIVCNGRTVPSEGGEITVSLTENEPDVDCTYTNRFDKNAKPPDPPKPDPDPTPIADLVVTKTVTPKTITLGQKATYKITVTNKGPSAATDVTVGEQLQVAPALLSLRATKGTCYRKASPPLCLLETIEPGEKVVITAVARPPKAGVIVNRVVASTATEEKSVRNNIGRARLKVNTGGISPAFTG